MNTIEKAVKRIIARADTVKDSTVAKIPTTSSEVSSDPVYSPFAHDPDKVQCEIDSKKLKAFGFLTPDNTDTIQAEQYRVLKRPLLTYAFKTGMGVARNSNIIMITSALEGEGKTFTSFNLSLSMAMERNSTVLLVDTDVIKGSLSRLLGLHEKIGLVDLLEDATLSISDVIINTDIPRLKIIPSGVPTAYSTELLASERMKYITDELSERYSDRVILYDAPPMLATSQAKVISELAGQILLVVEAGETPQELVKESVSFLDKNKYIGVVLNKSRFSSSGYYGGYYGTSR